MNRIVLKSVCLLLFFAGWNNSGLKGQSGTTVDKYWIMLSGKEMQVNPATFLTERSLQRRISMGIALDEKDYPVSLSYRNQLSQMGISLLQTSKWLNAFSAWLSEDEVQVVQELPFVREVRKIPKVQVVYDVDNLKTSYFPGYTQDQVTMLGLDELHQRGYMGQGVLISVMDNGFVEANNNPVLKHLQTGNRIVATRDFVNNEEDVYDRGSHGAYVLSILAGYLNNPFSPESNFVGSAPGASYILCHTESDVSETHQEEDNWVAAMEFADSLGADIFTTSLGYRSFDPGQGDYAYSQLDGNTTIITIAADIAASRGILVVNAAGNEGTLKLLAPADGDSVMAVAAVDNLEQIAGFSSRGPSGDGRLKPDISAMGQGTFFARSDGTISSGSGTSFSCPMISGFAACLLQTQKGLGNMDLFEAIIRSGDRYSNPDTAYGHGIPNGPLAYELIHGTTLPGIPQDDQFNDFGVSLYPNPAWESLHLIIQNTEIGYPAELTFTDLAGRRIGVLPVHVGPFINHIQFNPQMAFPTISQGVYILRLKNLSTSQYIFTGKVRINE